MCTAFKTLTSARFELGRLLNLIQFLTYKPRLTQNTTHRPPAYDAQLHVNALAAVTQCKRCLTVFNHTEMNLRQNCPPRRASGRDERITISPSFSQSPLCTRSPVWPACQASRDFSIRNYGF